MTHVPWNKNEDDAAAILFTAVGYDFFMFLKCKSEMEMVAH